MQVADLGSFTRASALLGIAQPALSRQVRQLEVELHQTLLNRNGRGVTLTEAGTRLFEHGRGILHQVDRTREYLEEMRGAPVGHTAIGLPPTVGRILTTPLVGEFRRRFPKATLGIFEGLSTYVGEWLSSGRIDVALLYNPAPSLLIETQPLVAEPLYLIGPAPAKREAKSGGSSATGAPFATGTPVALKELPTYGLIVPSRQHAVRMFVKSQLAAIGARINVAWEIDGIASILDLVAHGHGYAVLSLNAIRNDPLRARLLPRPIVKSKLVTSLAIATPSQRPLTPLAQQVVALVRELAPRELMAKTG